MRATVDPLQAAGLQAVAYVPFNHPFMDATSTDPRYAGLEQKDRRTASP